MYLYCMTQDEIWLSKYRDVVTFIEKNKRNPSKHNDEERGKYVNWLRHNRKLFNAGEMKGERKEKFEKLLGMMDLYRRKNQYE